LHSAFRSIFQQAIAGGFVVFGDVLMEPLVFKLYPLVTFYGSVPPVANSGRNFFQPPPSLLPQVIAGGFVAFGMVLMEPLVFKLYLSVTFYGSVPPVANSGRNSSQPLPCSFPHVIAGAGGSVGCTTRRVARAGGTAIKTFRVVRHVVMVADLHTKGNT
jgi:hypothetical protein